MRVSLRSFSREDYPAMVEVHNSLNIGWPERPRTPEAWAEVDRNRSHKYKYQRWVAVANGSVIGFASYSQSPLAYPAQSLLINIEVHPEYQRHGIGSALYQQVIDGLQKFNPPALRADAFTNLPQGYTFLQKRGFYEAFRETPVHLNVAAFDPSPYKGLETRLMSKGIVIKTLQELKHDRERDRKVYDLYWKAADDVPQEGVPGEKPKFEEWLSWGLNDPSILHDAYFIAVCGDQYIGLRELGTFGDKDVLLGSLLGVRREYRKRGIGLALQLRGIAYAKEHGYRLLKTCTAVQNIPMQKLFDKLGYVRDPEWQQCQKDLRGTK